MRKVHKQFQCAASKFLYSNIKFICLATTARTPLQRFDTKQVPPPPPAPLPIDHNGKSILISINFAVTGFINDIRKCNQHFREREAETA